MMRGKKICDCDRQRETLSSEHRIIHGLLMCLCVGCLVMYISVGHMTVDVRINNQKIKKIVASLKYQEHRILTYITRLMSQQELTNQKQDALAQHLMSQAEVTFSDLEMMSQKLEQTLLNNKQGSSNKETALNYEEEYARRRVENIVAELWYFMHDKLHALGETAELDNENSRNEQVSTSSNITYSNNIDHKLIHQAKVTEKKIAASPSTVVPDLEELDIFRKEESKIEANYSRETLDSSKRIVSRPQSLFLGKLVLFKEALSGYRRAMIDTLRLLKNADNAENRRFEMSMRLGNIVQRRLKILQNPKKCKMETLVRCEMKSCGFGCNMHHMIYCLITALATNRTLAEHGFGSLRLIFEPVSEVCVSKPNSVDVLVNDTLESSTSAKDNDKNTDGKIPETHRLLVNSEPDPQYDHVTLIPKIEDIWPVPGYIPLSIPQELAPQLTTFHGNPAAWWIGQFAQYLFRPTSLLMNHIRLTKRTLGYHKPIVGVHVRRTDKLVEEASFHSIEEYMIHVEDYFDQLQRSKPQVIRRVFLATDDSSVLQEARSKYPGYTFISDNSASKIKIHGRRTIDSINYIATDIYLLSRSDFLVCTFSSQVCRLAYELMQTLHGDASQNFRSLDDIYYFGGQAGHKMTVLESHSDNVSNTIDLKKGDSISVWGNHWNGFSKGVNERTRKTGMYPTYKVEDTISTFPVCIFLMSANCSLQTLQESQGSPNEEPPIFSRWFPFEQYNLSYNEV